MLRLLARIFLLLPLFAEETWAANKLEVQATLVELPRSPPCDRHPVGVTTRYRLEKVISGRLSDRTLLVVHRCPELARGPSRVGKGTAPPLRPGQTHVLSLHLLESIAGVLDRFSPDRRPRYEARLTDLASDPPRLVVVVVGGPGTGRKIQFDADSVTVGRGPDSDVLLNDSKVALRHLRLEAKEGQVVIHDLGSPQGTRINGLRLQGPRRATHKDLIEVGAYVLSVSLFQPNEIKDSAEP